MMRKLLEERFQLKIHTDNQPVRVYALTATRNLKIKESTGTGRASCRNGASGGLGLTCQYIPMDELVLRLRSAAPAYLDHPAIKGWGLTGVSDRALTWMGKGRLTGLAAAAGRGGGDGAAPLPPSGAPADPGGMSLFEAVEKQLGLKLTLTKH